MLVQRIVDALHDGGVVEGLGKHVDPYHNLKGDAAVIETLKQYLYALFLIDAVELQQFLDENLLHLLDVTSVCHAYFQRIQLVTMVLGHVLVVLGKQLRVLEGDDRTVDSFQHGRGVADTAHLTTGAVADDIVTHLHTAHHQGYAVVDVLENILGCKTQTG